MAGLLRKFIRGAADGALPAMIEDHKASILKARDEQLRKYQKEDIATEQKYRTDERIAGQEFATETEATRQEYQVGRDTVADQRSDRELALNEKQTAAQIATADAQLRVANLQADEQEDYADARQRYQDAAPEDRDAAAEYLLQIQGKLLGNKSGGGLNSATAPQIKEKKIFDPDTGEQIDSEFVVINPLTGDGQKVEFPEGARIPPQAAIEFYSANRDAATRLALDDKYGEGTADAVDAALAANPTAAPETPTAETAETPTTNPQGLIASRLQGFVLPEDNVSRNASGAQAGQQKRAAESERIKTEAIAVAKQLLETKDLSGIKRSQVRRQIEIALASDALSADEKDILNAAINRR